ncbi:unnamed protein product, partial [Adineta steineri]
MQSHLPRIKTYIHYKGCDYQCFDLNDCTAASVNQIRNTIPAALEIEALSSHDSIEIQNDENEYVVLNDYFLKKQKPWDTSTRDKKIKLKIVSREVGESNTEPNDLSMYSLIAYTSVTPLKFIYDVAPRQRLQYPDEANLVAIQTIKNDNHKKNSRLPILQIPIEYVHLIKAGGSVDVISAIVLHSNNHDHVSDFYLAPFRGFWPSGKKNRPSRDESFSNPIIQQITIEQIKMVKAAEDEESYQMKLSLWLMRTANAQYSTNTQALVKFDQGFNLSNIQSVVPRYNKPSRPLETGTNAWNPIKGERYSIICALR